MLPQHPVYRKLDAPVTLLSVELEDWFGLGVAFVVLSRLSDLVVGGALGWPRAEAGASVLMTGLLFVLWRHMRERAPRHYLRHLLEYLGEPHTYELGPDVDANPYVR
ncbi:MAG TPA: hypothetical protein VEP50_06185 [bacterium]|nr:hypothetical protein [bacterium]